MELPPAALRVVGVAAGQGGLLVTALTWAGCGTGFGVVAIVLLVVAAAAVALGAPSALAYLAVPLWLAWLARRVPGGARPRRSIPGDRTDPGALYWLLRAPRTIKGI